MTLMDHPTRVFLIVENRLVRETLVRLLRKRSDLCVVGQSSAVDTPDLSKCQCDIIVIYNIMHRISFDCNLSCAHLDSGSIGVVLIGMEEEEEQFLAAVRNGALGYLLHDASTLEFVAAVRGVARGECVFPPRLGTALFRCVARAAAEPRALPKHTVAHWLTLRQQQLVSLVAKGLTNIEIASQLHVSEFTIKSHMHRIMRRVEAESRHEVVEVVRASGYLAMTQ